MTSITERGLSRQIIRPYTDLLLHDMGAGLADGRPAPPRPAARASASALPVRERRELIAFLESLEAAQPV